MTDSTHALSPRYSWIARGMTLSQRVKYEEERWAYYLAFGVWPLGLHAQPSSDFPNPRIAGFPSAFICMWASSLGNAAIFALIYPVVSKDELWRL